MGKWIDQDWIVLSTNQKMWLVLIGSNVGVETESHSSAAPMVRALRAGRGKWLMDDEEDEGVCWNALRFSVFLFSTTKLFLFYTSAVST